MPCGLTVGTDHRFLFIQDSQPRTGWVGRYLPSRPWVCQEGAERAAACNVREWPPPTGGKEQICATGAGGRGTRRVAIRRPYVLGRYGSTVTLSSYTSSSYTPTATRQDSALPQNCNATQGREALSNWIVTLAHGSVKRVPLRVTTINKLCPVLLEDSPFSYSEPRAGVRTDSPSRDREERADRSH